MIDFLTHNSLLSYAGVALGFTGIALLLFGVVPAQIKEGLRKDNHILIRRLLPVLTLIKVAVGLPLFIYWAHRTVSTPALLASTDFIRLSIGLVFFILGVSWLLIYKKG